jgi:hypothetical protein
LIQFEYLSPKGIVVLRSCILFGREFIVVPLSAEYPFIRECNCCPDDDYKTCKYHVGGVHKKHIKELTDVFTKYSEIFNEEDYKIFLQDIVDIFKVSNLYFLEEGYINNIMENK